MEIKPYGSFILSKKRNCNPVTFWKRSHSWARALHNTDCKVALGSTHLTGKHGLQYIKPNTKLITPLHVFFVLHVSQPACTLHIWSGWAALKQLPWALHRRRAQGQHTHPVELWGAPVAGKHGQKPSSGILNSEDFGFCLGKQIPFYFTVWVARSGIYGCWQILCQCTTWPACGFGFFKKHIFFILYVISFLIH